MPPLITAVLEYLYWQSAFGATTEKHPGFVGAIFHEILKRTVKFNPESNL